MEKTGKNNGHRSVLSEWKRIQEIINSKHGKRNMYTEKNCPKCCCRTV